MMGLFDFFRRKKEKLKHKRVKIGLALGGGGARGFAHLGAIKAFEENHIDFDFVSGTSAGSFAGALYCAGFSYKQMYEAAKELKRKDIKPNRFLFMPSKMESFEGVIRGIIGDISFEELKKPFAAVAVDLISTDEIVITKGSVAKAVTGSCAVPGIFVPVELDNMHLADGGLQNTIPSDVPRMFDCDYVVAVDVNPARGSGTNSLKMIDVLSASMRILMKSNAIKGYLNADIVIQPETKRFSSTKLDGLEEMIEEGYAATMEKMPEILDLISKKRKEIFNPNKTIKTRIL